MRTRRSFVAGAALLVCALPYICRAEMLTFAIEGIVQSTEDPLDRGIVQVGDRVVYEFTFDSSAPNEASFPETRGEYSGDSATFRSGSQTIVAQLPVIRIETNDWFQVRSILPSELYPGLVGSLFFTFSDPLSSVLASPDLPAEPYPLTEFGLLTFGGVIAGVPDKPSETSLYFNGTIDRFYKVPEPASILLFIVLSGIFVKHR